MTKTLAAPASAAAFPLIPLYGKALSLASAIPLPLVQLAGGVIFALAYEYSASLFAPLLVHVAGNFSIYTLPFLLK